MEPAMKLTSSMGAGAGAAATVAAPPASVTLKLLIDAKAKRVLYAEAGKEVVDFLFAILATPVGAVAKLLTAGVANIYASAAGMDPAYMQSGAVRDALLNSHRYTLLQCPAIRGHLPAPPSTTPVARWMPQQQPPVPVSYPYQPAAAPAPTVSSRGCPSCGYVKAGGFVQGLVTYTIMDDLTVAPTSYVSNMALLSKLNGEEKGLVLEEKSVKIGPKERLDILKASLQSSTVLTDVFISKSSADVSLSSQNKKARTSSDKTSAVQEKHDKIPDYYV